MKRLCILLLSSALFLCACQTEGAEMPVQTNDTSEAIEAIVTEASDTTEMPETTAPVTETVTEVPLPEEKCASFLGVGDAIVHPGIWMQARKEANLANEGREYDFSHVFDGVRDTVMAADLAFINQETLMAGAEYGYSGYPRFNTPRELAKDILDAGFDVVNIANNHMMDMLADGFASTIDFWQTQDCILIGGYENTEDYNTPRIVEVNGIRVAFLSYCYGTNGLSMQPGYELIIPYLDRTVIEAQCAEAKKAADFVFVSVHWGTDSVQAVTEEQKTYAQIFADCGVDVVLGHHPHLIQPITLVTGKDGNEMLCAYSLGNFFSLMAESENMLGGMLTFDMVVCGDEKRIENVVFQPTYFYYNTGFFGQWIYPLADVPEDLTATHGTKTYKGREPMTKAELIAYLQSQIDDMFLPENLRGNAGEGA